MGWHEQYCRWLERNHLRIANMTLVALRRRCPTCPVPTIEEVASQGVNEAKVRVLSEDRDLTAESYFVSWMVKTATNYGTDQLRRGHVRRTRGLAAGTEPTTLADESLEAREIVGLLSHEERTILTLHYVDELGLLEIAVELNIQPDAPDSTRVSDVRRRRDKARQRLKEIMDRGSG